MQVIKGYEKEAIPAACAVALGMFDGVHMGHKAIIQPVIDYARQYPEVKTAVITLATHPRALTQGKAPKLLTDLDRRLELFASLNIDYVLVLEFDEKLMQTSAEDYLQMYLKDTLNAEFISIGYDHHFGKARRGTPMLLRDWCQDNHCQLEIVEAFKFNNEVVSSSIIRSLIEDGEIEKANQLLGYDYSISGEVISGDKRGRELGFATANIAYAENIVLPANGVYFAMVKVAEDYFKSVVNIGFRPTFKDENKLSLEVHILNFTQDIYGEKLELRFLDRIREEKKFNSKEELIEQIKKDIASVEKNKACLMN